MNTFIAKQWGLGDRQISFLGVPSVFLRGYSNRMEKPISTTEMAFVLHLMSYSRPDGNLPHPSIGTLAKLMGKTPRTVQRVSSSLQKKGYLRIPAKDETFETNLYDLGGLRREIRELLNDDLP